jgi:hypothetical protein
VPLLLLLSLLVFGSSARRRSISTSKLSSRSTNWSHARKTATKKDEMCSNSIEPSHAVATACINRDETEMRSNKQAKQSKNYMRSFLPSSTTTPSYLLQKGLIGQHQRSHARHVTASNRAFQHP